MGRRKVEYQLTTPDHWYAHLNKFLLSSIEGPCLILENELGEGKLHYLKVQDGFWAQQLDFILRENLELFRVAKPKNDFFLIDFYLSDAEITRRASGKVFKQSFENINLVLTSATVNAKINIEAKKRVKIFNILVSRDWLMKNVIQDHAELKEYFETDDPIYLSENLDYRLKDLLKRIDFEHDKRLTSVSHIIQIVDYLFNRFNSRELTNEKRGIHPEDLNRLMKVREVMDSNPEKEILLKDLSEKAGMSLSKFKRLFKQVLGTTPYRYHLRNKMEKAMEVLQQGRFSVSETGFLLGYSNLSQFSKAFKNHFGLLPSEAIR